MEKNLQEYSDMLYLAAKEVCKIIKSPKMTSENKMLVASANTLALTAKTAIQTELLKYKIENTAGNTTQLIQKING